MAEIDDRRAARGVEEFGEWRGEERGLTLGKAAGDGGLLVEQELSGGLLFVGAGRPAKGQQVGPVVKQIANRAISLALLVLFALGSRKKRRG